MIYTIRQIKNGTGFDSKMRFVSHDDAKKYCSPDELEGIADELENPQDTLNQIGKKNLADALRAIAKKQRALLEGHP